ncbi:MAG: hypothetical protein V8S95_13830, partial [Odoribacter sp.]
WANSAIVTAIGKNELENMGYQGLFAGMDFQDTLERKAWEEGGGGLYAPAQVLTDFLEGKQSQALPSSSYKPGIKSSLIHEWLPTLVYHRLASGLGYFGKKAPGFVSAHALLLGVETRTSSHCGFPGQTNTGIRKLQGSILVEKGLVMPEVSFRQLWMGRNVLNI